MAPLWDADRRTFVAMMSIRDFIQTLRKYQHHKMSLSDLETRTIGEMLAQTHQVFAQPEFTSVDAEDSVYQLCCTLNRTAADFAPIIDPDTGNLVGILGYMDILHLLLQASQQFPQYFSGSLQQHRIGNYRNPMSANPQTTLGEVLASIEINELPGMPIIDASRTVVGFYRETDVAFVTKSSEADEVLNLFSDQLVGDVIRVQQNEHPMGSNYSCTCSISDSVKTVMEKMTHTNCATLVVIDHAATFVGTVTVKDIIWHFFSQPASNI